MIHRCILLSNQEIEVKSKDAKEGINQISSCMCHLHKVLECRVSKIKTTISSTVLLQSHIEPKGTSQLI